MTRRERNRRREHEPGHELIEGEPNKATVMGAEHYPPGEARLYTCACGWLGWMRPL